MELLLHPAASLQIEGIVRRPGGTVLLHGPKGVGKRTAALEIARRLGCAGCQDGSCHSCRMALAGNHPDILLLEPDAKGKIGIEAVQELQHKLRYEQYQPDGHRVAIVANADTLTLPSQHALLKTLEEPPVGTTILVTATAPTSLLETIRSRCRQVYLPLPEKDQVRRFLQEQGTKSLDAGRVTELSHGVPGAALGLLNDASSFEEEEQVATIVAELIESEGLFERMSLAATMAAKPESRDRYVQELTVQARQLQRQPARASRSLLEAVERLRQRLGANVNPKTAFEALAVELA